MAKIYTTPSGERYPLVEARYNMAFTAYRSDRKKAVINDPRNCWAALGIRRDPEVLDVYIGSGRDAYVIFKATPDAPAQAVHFIINTTMRHLIDAFDRDKTARTMTIELMRPSSSEQLSRRTAKAKERYVKTKAKGKAKTETPAQRARTRRSRVQRIGVAHRPRAQISKSGNVSMEGQMEMDLEHGRTAT